MIGQQTASPRNACCLNAGKSPAVWQNDLSRKTDRLSSLPRACSWLEPLTTVRIQLKQHPLLGTCLPEVIGQGASPATTNPSKSQPRKLPSNLPDVSQPAPRDRPQGTTLCPPVKPQLITLAKAKRSTSDCSPPQPLSQIQQSVSCQEQPLFTGVDNGVDKVSLSPTVLGELGPRVSSELLHRLATQSVTTAFSPPPDQEIAASANGLQPENVDRRKYQLTGQFPGPSVVPPVQQNSQSHQNWLHRIANRSQHSLHQQIERLHQRSLSAFNQEALINQWSLPINEESTSLESLTYWSNPAISPLRRENSVDRSLTDTRLNQLSNQFLNSPSALSSTTQFNQDLEQSATRSPTSSSPLGNSLASQLPSPTPVTESSLDALRRSSTLPSLTPAQTVDQPTPNLAAAIVQKAKPEPPPETDLNLLATHIKRILDDEARRYGINV